MEVFFADRRVAGVCSSMKTMRRKYGEVRAKRLAVRLQQLRLAPTLADITEVTGCCHELTGNLRGQLAVDLDGPYRLLFSALDECGRRRGPGDWSTVLAIVVEGIDDYH